MQETPQNSLTPSTRKAADYEPGSELSQDTESTSYLDFGRPGPQNQEE